uniref:DUF834 domain-containing protein n=1 Tax=Oryza glumipatula TaxID=40148 RepID=A0A0E0B0E7_9ORYZ
MASGTAEKQATTATTGAREDQGGREASVDSGDHHHLSIYKLAQGAGGEDGSDAGQGARTPGFGLRGACMRRS